ncbi:hypothetical protein ACEU6F_20540 [Aeromonas salmonicida]|uniref:hypothetical protein n=1 Tax=Aeromonas salmonicida TaxID=645 RepID=UPI0035A68856
MKYTLMISLLAPTLLAGCELEKKEDPPFKGQHITAAYDTGVVCRQLQQEWQQDDIASQLSCHYLTVPLDYDKEWVDVALLPKSAIRPQLPQPQVIATLGAL